MELSSRRSGDEYFEEKEQDRMSRSEVIRKIVSRENYENSRFP